MKPIIAPDLRVLFVAINPATAALSSGQPFAAPTNMFWRLLHVSGLTRHCYLPSEAEHLLDEGIGLVSMVDRATKKASELRANELFMGGRRLALTVKRYHPRTIALLGLTLVPFVLPDANEPGPGLKRTTVGRARLFVLPNPSGRNRSYPGFAAKLPWYRRLASILDDM
jgi:double-stranded uracil-DNA glycosylase